MYQQFVKLLGVNIPAKKRLVISLTYIHGIGLSRSKEIISALNLDEDMHAGDLSADQLAELSKFLQSNYVLEGALRRQVKDAIALLVYIGCYRGIRHTKK